MLSFMHGTPILVLYMVNVFVVQGIYTGVPRGNVILIHNIPPEMGGTKAGTWCDDMSTACARRYSVPARETVRLAHN